MFDYLREQMSRGCSRARREHIKRRRTVRRFRYFFCLGFVGAIADRYVEMREAADNITTALVRADALVKSYVDQNYQTTMKSTSLDGRKNWAAIGAGRAHGRQVSLATNVTGESSVVRGQLAD